MRLLATTILSLSLLFTACEKEELELSDTQGPIDLPTPIDNHCSCDDILSFSGSTCISTCNQGYWGNIWFGEVPTWIWQNGSINNESILAPFAAIDTTPIVVIDSLPFLLPPPSMYVPIEICSGVDTSIPILGRYQVDYQIVEDYEFDDCDNCTNLLSNAIPIRIVKLERLPGDPFFD